MNVPCSSSLTNYPSIRHDTFWIPKGALRYLNTSHSQYTLRHTNKRLDCHTTHINTLYRQNAVFVNVKPGNSCSNHKALTKDAATNKNASKIKWNKKNKTTQHNALPIFFHLNVLLKALHQTSSSFPEKKFYLLLKYSWKALMQSAAIKPSQAQVAYHGPHGYTSL